MESGNNFPWDVLKAECLRLICHQVCASSQVGGLTSSFGKREEMIGFLRDVTERGCECSYLNLVCGGVCKPCTRAVYFEFESSVQLFLRTLYTYSFHIVETALTAFGESKQTQRDNRETNPSVKRKDSDNGDDDDDDIENQDAEGANNDEAPVTPTSHQAYNTRFKGVKRVKMGREVPEGFPYTPHRRARAPRKSLPTSGSQTKTADENGAVKRNPRGRPRKYPRVASDHSAVPVTPGRPPTSSTKQVFDGVVVMKRTHSSKKPELEDTVASHVDPDADVDAEGDMDGEAEEIIGPDSLELNGFIGVAGEDDHHDSNQGDPLVP